MDATEIMSLLPEEAPPELTSSMLRNHRDELGGDLLVYRREAWLPEDDFFIGWPDLDEQKEKATKRHWQARCTCTACGENFVTAWRPGGVIILVSGPCGQLMPEAPWLTQTWNADVPGDWEDEITEIECDDGDGIDCVYCGAALTLTSAKALRNGRTCQVMAGELTNLGRYTAVLFWLVSRHFDSDGDAATETYPMYAVVVDDDGRPRYFSHARAGMFGRMMPDERWHVQRARRDPLQRRYYSYYAINGTKIGGFMYRRAPEDMAGKTGEKTGLAEYISAGGHWAALYLEFWRKHPSIENLAKAGWINAIDELISDEVETALTYGGFIRCPERLEDLADFSRVKPHEMLGMSRHAVKAYKSWNSEELELYRDMQTLCGTPAGDAEAVFSYMADYGSENLGRMRNWVRAADLDGGFDFPRLNRYLTRQGEANGQGLRLFMDYRDMLVRNVPGPLTEIELWPPHLRQAHDRLAAMQRAADDAKYLGGFQRIVETWGALEWSDGSICAVLPRCNGDLVREGKTLRHCVGGYGQSHVDGKIVVFIRHARRPERSWFTLNIDLTGKQPREIQLHGYGNEHAHGKLLRIPVEVRQFCDKWEENVLKPTFGKVKAAETRRRRECIRT